MTYSRSLVHKVARPQRVQYYDSTLAFKTDGLFLHEIQSEQSAHRMSDGAKINRKCKDGEVLIYRSKFRIFGISQLSLALEGAADCFSCTRLEGQTMNFFRGPVKISPLCLIIGLAER
jgi:hypothetical protein